MPEPPPDQLVDVDELQAVLNLTGTNLYPTELYERVAAAAAELLLAYLLELPEGETYRDVPTVREAALALAVDLWQHRVAPGGVTQAADFTPGPWRLGRSMVSRVSGLIGPHLDTGSMVG